MRRGRRRSGSSRKPASSSAYRLPLSVKSIEGFESPYCIGLSAARVAACLSRPPAHGADARAISGRGRLRRARDRRRGGDGRGTAAAPRSGPAGPPRGRSAGGPTGLDDDWRAPGRQRDTRDDGGRSGTGAALREARAKALAGRSRAPARPRALARWRSAPQETRSRGPGWRSRALRVKHVRQG